MASEEEIIIEGAVSIGATVTYADKGRRSPAVILIQGTGKGDRDGNQTGLKWDLYRNLAGTFSDMGCVVARYDKRGIGKTAGSLSTAGLSDLVDDAVSVIRHIKSLPFVDEDRVIVCGHSEGAIIATILSRKEKVAGLILLGGAGVSLKDALYYQNRLVADQSESMKGFKGFLIRRTSGGEKGIAKVDSIFGKALSTDKATIGAAHISAKWLREHGSYTSEDLVSIVRDFGGPVLAITGTADISMDYRMLDAFDGASNVECFTPENVNHILREIDDDNSILNIRKQYARLAAKPMDPGVEKRIRDWMSSNFIQA